MVGGHLVGLLLLREEVGIAVPVIHSSLWAISFKNMNPKK